MMIWRRLLLVVRRLRLGIVLIVRRRLKISGIKVRGERKVRQRIARMRIERMICRLIVTPTRCRDALMLRGALRRRLNVIKSRRPRIFNITSRAAVVRMRMKSRLCSFLSAPAAGREDNGLRLAELVVVGLFVVHIG
jgi:hypothetical protein